jgi:nitrogen regulatory protein PII
MNNPVKCAHITVVIHVALFSQLKDHLAELGINHLYHLFGRSMMLNEGRGFFNVLRSSDVISEPVEVLHFYLPLEYEAPVMKAIVKSSRLDVPGRGSIFSRHIDLHNGPVEGVLCQVKTDKLPSVEAQMDISLYSNLVQIHCTMSKGLVDEVARLLLHLGVVPMITNAAGTGLRDQLGLLRITIPKEKELLSVVVGQQEANSIMDKIITWGKLDRPGRGFIWQGPIEKGVINFKTSQKVIGQAASTEQIIAAIDSLKGSFSWRQGSTGISHQGRRDYFRGTEFMMQVNEGMSLNIAKEMIKLGISGATVQLLRSLAPEREKEKIVVPKEVVRVVVTEAQARKVFEYAFRDLNEQGLASSDFHTFCVRVLRAFNYKTVK